MMPINKFDYDVVIVGAGLVGCIQALLLAKHNFNVLLVDAYAVNENKFIAADGSINQDLTPDSRMSAITIRNQQILSDLDLWDDVALRCGAMKKVNVWDDNGPGEITLNSLQIGMPNLAVILENNFLLELVNRKINQAKNIKILRPCKIKDIFKLANGLEISIDCNDTILSYKINLVIGADGAQSWVRNYFNFELDRKSYDHTALITNVYTEQSHFDQAFQVFLADGPLAFLPWQQKNCCSIVWSQNPEQALYWQQCPTDEFNQELSKHIKTKLGDVISSQSRQIFPLHMQHVKQYYKDAVVLIGDAAHTIHPLAGQGLNLGIYDAFELAKVLVEAKEKNHHIAHSLVLNKYELRRKGHNQQMIQAMAGFKDFYGSQSLELGLLRNLGMNLMNNSGFLKKRVMLHAAGFGID